MTSECRDCRAGLEHCHGALIHHAYLRAECTEVDCYLPDGAHVMHLDCAAVGCACDDVVPGAVSAHRFG